MTTKDKENDAENQNSSDEPEGDGGSEGVETEVQDYVLALNKFTQLVSEMEWPEHLAIDNDTDRGPMAFPPSRNTEQLAEAVMRHGAILGSRFDTREQFAHFFGRVDSHHANRMVTAINVMHFTCNARAKVTQQIQSGTTDLIKANIPTKR